MRTNTKIGIAVAALVALVFVVTIIAQLPKDAPKLEDDTTNPALGTPGGVTVDLSGLQYTPGGRRAALREYQQFYEKGDYLIPFWISNRTAVPLTITFNHTSCGQCGYAELAIIDAPPRIDGTGDPDPFGTVLGGVMGQMPADEKAIQPFGLDQMEYLERNRLMGAIPDGAWQRLKASNSTRENVGEVKEFVLPQGEAGRPTWACVRLNVNASFSKNLTTRFIATRPDNPAQFDFFLGASVSVMEPCAVYPELIDFGTVAAGTDPAPKTVYFWSSTRGTAPGALAPLAPPVKPDPKRTRHIITSDPVPATPDELAALAAELSTKDLGQRVAGAYKMTLNFTRAAADGVSPDAPIGPSERQVEFPPESGVLPTTTPKVTVKTNLRGPVRLENGDKIDLLTYEVRNGLETRFRVSTDDPDAELEWVKEDTTPTFLEVSNPTKEKKGERGYWTFTLSIAKNVGGDLPPGSVVVLRIKGTGRLVRLPVSGSGRS